MTGIQRQEAIKAALSNPDTVISANKFAKQFNVSRQTIVGDIALLRARGEQIIATPQGYRYQMNQPHHTILVVQHTADQIEQELTALVDAGVIVADVQVDHPVYGLLKGELAIQTNADVRQFIHHLKQTSGEPLSTLTNGLHMHKIEYAEVADLEKAKTALRKLHILYEN